MHKTQEHAIFDNIFALWKITTANVHVMLPDHTKYRRKCTKRGREQQVVGARQWLQDT